MTVADPHVHAAMLVHRDGRRFVWLVSQTPAEHTVRPVAAGKLTEVDADEPVDQVTLPAYGVRVLRLALDS